MRRILVTAISGDIGNGILKILQERGDEIFGCDINQYAVGMDKVKEFFVVPRASHQDYIPSVIEICKRNKIQYIIPSNERELESLSENREIFENQKISLVMQNRKVLRICLDKYYCMKFLKTKGISVPETYLADREEKIEEKCLLKPRKSNGCKNIKLLESNVLNPEDKVRSNIIQRIIPGKREYTVGVFSDGKIKNMISFRRELKNGYSNLVELVENPQINEIAGKILQMLDLRGYINIQMKEWEGKYYVFEINPRISGTVYFRHMLGFCDILWWLDYIDGKSILQYQNRYEKAIGLRELSEKFIELRRKNNV